MYKLGQMEMTQPMFDVLRPIRLWVTAGILVGGSFLLHALTRRDEAIIPRQPVRMLPLTIARWTGREFPFEEQVVGAAGVSDYTNRFYFESGSAPIQLYVGYYASQKNGDRIHSPKNCLPGSGWDPVKSRYATISIPGRNNIVVNEYLVQKDQNRQLVFYWYQGRGRITAGEFVAKFWMTIDSITRNRTDGALVRLVTPVMDGEGKAYERLSTFTQVVFPSVDKVIPR
jgi:EpsI family protein